MIKKVKNIDIEKSNYFTNKKYQLIVSMTTWKKRINFCYDALNSICNQLLKPDVFYLVLSTKEFPNKLNDLPPFIHTLLNTYPFFKLLWINNNIKQFKKNLPILSKYWNNPNVLIFTTDDDIFYKNTYLNNVYEKFLELNPNIPDTILTYDFGWPANNPETYDSANNTTRLIGSFEVLYPPFFISDIVLKIEPKDINSNIWISEDWWITYNLMQNKKLQWHKCEFNFLINLLNIDFKFNNVSPLYEKYYKLSNETILNNVKHLYINKSEIYDKTKTK